MPFYIRDIYNNKTGGSSGCGDSGAILGLWWRGGMGGAGLTLGQALCTEAVDVTPGKVQGLFGFSSSSSCMHVA